MDTIHVAVLHRFAAQVHSGVVVIHRCESAAVAQRFEDDYFDWVYIDGNHLYEYVQRDLEMLRPRSREAASSRVMITRPRVGGETVFGGPLTSSSTTSSSSNEPSRLDG